MGVHMGCQCLQGEDLATRLSCQAQSLVQQVLLEYLAGGRPWALQVCILQLTCWELQEVPGVCCRRPKIILALTYSKAMSILFVSTKMC